MVPQLGKQGAVVTLYPGLWAVLHEARPRAGEVVLWASDFLLQQMLTPRPPEGQSLWV